jgi:prepilin-type N-terminal cleavage/methylation domain-containing protein
MSAPLRSRHRAFSLVELLVAIGIITLLLAMLLPVLSRVRHAGRATKCLANLQQ